MNRQIERLSLTRRFQFGANWESFLNALNDERILEAEKSLRSMLGVDDLSDKRFSDIGSGSGLFSLAARRLGARVHSFDYDPRSVRCTEELEQRYYPNDETWIVGEGSVLDNGYLTSLGEFDVVYSWGVLRHTGDMKKALEHTMLAVANHGLLFVAIYNDQGTSSNLKFATTWISRRDQLLSPAATCAQ